MTASVINATINGVNATGGNVAELELQVGGTTAITVNSAGYSILANPLPIASGGTGINSAGTTGNVLTSNGTAWVSQAVGGGFAAGTVMLFGQTSAPTGWTKDTINYNNSALRVVTGSASTGGSVDFTTAFSNQSVTGTIGATTLTTTQIPSHTHTAIAAGGFTAGDNGGPGVGAGSTGSTGGGSSHTHSLSGNSINLAVKYVDIIRATKD